MWYSTTNKSQAEGRLVYDQPGMQIQTDGKGKVGRWGSASLKSS
jgi:hypothetical protein